MSATPVPGTSVRPLSLDDVILLNDEIQGLIAAGIPLHAGLSGFASRVGGSLRQFSRRLEDRLAAGVPLGDALQAESAALPGEYRVLLAAGMRSGRFDAALASLAEYAASLRDLRSSLRRAMIYPGVVCGLSYAILAAVFMFLVPELLRNIESLNLHHGVWYSALTAMQRSVKFWGPGIPAILFLIWFATVCSQWTTNGNATTSSERYLGFWQWIPGVGGALRAAHWSRFAHLLAMLVEADVPFAEAARLSAAAIGDRRLEIEIERVAAQSSGGESLSAVLSHRSGVPPMLRWLMTRGERESQLGPTLREAAAQYAQRAAIRAELVQKFLPMAMVALVGGGITLIYALTIFIPLTTIWRGLGTSG
ncbi:MAG: type II secretion system F family protein [Planctomycetaceae bacterium]|nr:type II secretion system F family protein [Planctomycetaceae bacterium]